MVNECSIWRLNHAGEPIIERITLTPAPSSLDDATQRLPGGGYTTFRTFERFGVLRLESHFNRLEETARLAGKTVRLDRKWVIKGLHLALTAFPSADMRVRVVLSLEGPEQIFIMIDTLHTPSARDYHNGVKVVTRHLHRENPKAKLTGFIETAAGVRQELPRGVNEAIMVGEDDRLLEGLSSNFFAVKEGAIWTAEQGVLSGITRALVLDVIQQENIPLQLEGVRLDDVAKLEEAFITSASRAVLPVSQIDGQPVGKGRPGAITQRLMQGYQDRLKKELDFV